MQCYTKAAELAAFVVRRVGERQQKPEPAELVDQLRIRVAAATVNSVDRGDLSGHIPPAWMDHTIRYDRNRVGRRLGGRGDDVTRYPPGSR